MTDEICNCWRAPELHVVSWHRTDTRCDCDPSRGEWCPLPDCQNANGREIYMLNRPRPARG
jgi:hypothetical protein